MAIIPNSVPLTGPIAPIDDTDTYPTWFARYGKGGFRSVDDLTALAAIPDLHLEEGMLVKIIADDTYYTYKNGGWVLESFAAGEAGADGLSAYEIAVLDGFVGTETEWLESLKGEAGVDGADGAGRTLDYELKSADFIAQSFFVYGVDTTANAVTATLGVKTNSDVVYFADATIGAVTHNPLTILGDGCTIAGAASLTLTNNAECVGLIYDAANTNWVIFGTESSGTSGDGGGADAEPYRIINGTSEAGFYTPGGSLDFTIDGNNFGTIAPNKILIGDSTGTSITTATHIYAIGDLSLAGATTAYDNIAIGYKAINLNEEGSNNIAIGEEALAKATYCSGSVAIGSLAMREYGTNQAGNWTGDNVAIGLQSMRYVGAGNACVAVGAYALQRGDNPFAMTAVGWSALPNVTTANACVAVGNGSLGSLTTGTDNTAVGPGAGYYITTGNGNTCLGSDAGDRVTGGVNDCVYIGNECPSINTLLDFPTAGWRNGYFSGSGNTFIGAHCGYDTPNGGVSDSLVTGSNNTLLGQYAKPSSLTASNEITLGNSAITSLRCAVTSITALSDERDKTNIQDLSLGLDFVNTLRPVEFEWNTRDGAKVGVKDFNFIAQDLKRAQEEVDAPWLGLVLENNPDKLEATPGRLIPILVKAIQELELRLAQQDAEIQLLKAQLS